MRSHPSITLEDGTNVSAIISLGSNLASEFGPPLATLKEAINRLHSLSEQQLLVSSYYRTTPESCPAGAPDFVNAVLIMRPGPELCAPLLLQELHVIEQQLGRLRGTLRNQSRTLDLDLICYGNQRQQTPNLLIPHPRAHLRRFVLAPLAELVPNLILPGQTATVLELLDKLPSAGSMCRIESDWSS